MRSTLRIAFTVWALLGAFALSAQQDPVFTNYLFNALVFNPAYAGSNNHLSANLIHRQQWAGLEGAPLTQSLTVHSPFKNERTGLGLSIVNDLAGAAGTTEVNASYAYRFNINEHWRLSAGLQAGLGNWRGDWSKLTLEDNTDQVFQENPSRWLPNFGAGVYLNSERFYAGFGCPRLLEYDLRKARNDQGLDLYARNYRHYYTTLGAAFPLDEEEIVLRPSLLLQSTGWFSAFRQDDDFQNIGSPTRLDVDLSVLLHKTFWLGLSYRTALETRKSSNDSVDFWAAWFLRNGLRFGASYDIGLSRIRTASPGSFELMLGYEFDIKLNKVATPRYF